MFRLGRHRRAVVSVRLCDKTGRGRQEVIQRFLGPQKTPQVHIHGGPRDRSPCFTGRDTQNPVSATQLENPLVCGLPGFLLGGSRI